MSIYPSLESRLRALEHRQYSLETHTEELVAGIAASVERLSNDMTAVKADIRHLSNDMAASFKQLSEYQGRTEDQIEARFNKIEKDIADIRANMATKDDIANMATKDDIANMATKDDIANINGRLNRLETAFGEHTTLLTQILERLPG